MRVRQCYPFELTNFFRLANNLEYIYERKFNLQYYMNLSFRDYDNTYLKELDWQYGKLIQVKKQEKEGK